MGVWEEEDTEARLKDHSGETPVGNCNLPGEYFICLLLKRRQQGAQGWKRAAEEDGGRGQRAADT